MVKRSWGGGGVKRGGIRGGGGGGVMEWLRRCEKGV